MVQKSSKIKQKIFSIILIGLIASSICSGRSNSIPLGARAAGMGDAFISQSDVWAAVHNQAGLAEISRPAIGLYFENRYLIKDLSTRAITAVVPTSLGAFGFQINAFGPSKWLETQASISYSKKLSKRISGGIALNYFGTKLPESNASIRAAGFDVGMIYKLAAKSWIGLHASNPLSTELKTLYSSEKIPYRIRLGGHTNFAENFTFAYEVEKNSAPNPQYRAGIEWFPVSNFAVRFGANGNPSTFSFGLGYKTKRIATDFAFQYHQYLGATPYFSINFSL